MKAIPFFIAIAWLTAYLPAEAGAPCRPLDERPIKVEAWMTKKRYPEFREMRKAFRRMGNTYVSIFTYPGENPSRVVAIGSCVPAYIARHILEKTVEYYGEVKSLVHPGFVAPHWVGLATSLFAENSFSHITPEQLNRLLDPTLDNDQFHALYREFTVQPEKVEAFGQMLPNPKLMTP